MLQHLIIQWWHYGRSKTIKQNFKLLALKVVAVPHKRWLLTRGFKYSDLTLNLLVWKTCRWGELAADDRWSQLQIQLYCTPPETQVEVCSWESNNMLLEHGLPTWGMGEGFLEKEVKILFQIYLCFPFCQFLPDDDEAASMFTVVIDKEVTQLEKKKKTSATGRVCFCCKDIYSQCTTSWKRTSEHFKYVHR